MTDAADILRAQKATSTDPDRLEREAARLDMSDPQRAIKFADLVLLANIHPEGDITLLAREYLKALGVIDFLCGTPNNLGLAREVRGGIRESGPSDVPAEFSGVSG